MHANKARKIVEEVATTYNTIASHFSKTRFTAGSFLQELTWGISEDVSLLDIGCGNGRLVEVLPEKISYIGIDVSEKLLQKARKIYPEQKNNFRIFNGITLPFENRSFSHIYMLASFHHIPKPFQQKFIHECKRVLQPNGKIVVTVWHLWRRPFLHYFFLSLLKKIVTKELNFFDIYIPWKNKEGEVLGKRYFHMFRKKELEQLFKKAGFQNIQITIISLRKQKNYVVKATI